MSVYYNEHDPRAAAWLRELMREGLIPRGWVDERDIKDVQKKDIRGFTQCHFFAGIGGWPYALRLAKWPDDWPVWTGSCPCQPYSGLGHRRGKGDPRNLWPVFSRLIAECLPSTVFGEQVEDAVELDEWLDDVQDQLEDSGYSTWAAVFPAAAVGAPHVRDRLYFVGDRSRFVADPDRHRHAPDRTEPGERTVGAGMELGFWSSAERVQCPDGKRRLLKPGLRTLADGVPGRLALLRGAGNAIVPQQAAAFIRAFVEVCE